MRFGKATSIFILIASMAVVVLSVIDLFDDATTINYWSLFTSLILAAAAIHNLYRMYKEEAAANADGH